MKSSIPGFGRPMALTYPPGTSVKQGLACPALGSSPTDFVTTAPHPHPIMRASEGPVSSMIPEATMPGLSSTMLPISVLSDTMDDAMADAFIMVARAG